MAQENKTVSGILSFLPLAAFLAYIISFLGFFMPIFVKEIHHEEQVEAFYPGLVYIIIFAIVLGIVSLGALVYFIIHAINNKAIDSTERLVWILIFIFTGMIGYPIYWYMRIYKNQVL